MKQPIDSKCRMCYKAEEHVKYIVVGCTILLLSEYTNRYNKESGYIHWMICKHRGYMLLSSITNMYLKGSQMSTVPLLCGTCWLSQI
jgi:hypothetical protein